MYSEDSILRYGKYRSYRLAEVPASYLQAVYLSRSWPDPDLYAYVESHAEQIGVSTIVEDQKRKKQPGPASPRRKKFCDKVAYPTEQWARQALDAMNVRSRRFRMRCYYCDQCNLWHLTSMSLEVWQAEPKKRRRHHRPPVRVRRQGSRSQDM